MAKLSKTTIVAAYEKGYLADLEEIIGELQAHLDEGRRFVAFTSRRDEKAMPYYEIVEDGSDVLQGTILEGAIIRIELGDR